MPRYENFATLKTERKQALRIARQLCYPNSVLQQIKNAKSIFSIQRILTDARKNV